MPFATEFETPFHKRKVTLNLMGLLIAAVAALIAFLALLAVTYYLVFKKLGPPCRLQPTTSTTSSPLISAIAFNTTQESPIPEATDLIPTETTPSPSVASRKKREVIQEGETISEEDHVLTAGDIEKALEQQEREESKSEKNPTGAKRRRFKRH